MGWDETQAASLWPLGFFLVYPALFAQLSRTGFRSHKMIAIRQFTKTLHGSIFGSWAKLCIIALLTDYPVAVLLLQGPPRGRMLHVGDQN